MSDNEAPKAGSGWSDRERLTVLFAAIDHSNIRLDFNTAPRPAGRSAIACQRMVERMKGMLKVELEALKAGNPIVEPNGTPKKAPATPRKRKTKADGEDGGEGDGSPKKRGRGRPKKSVEVVDEQEEKVEVEADDKTKVKYEDLGVEDDI